MSPEQMGKRTVMKEDIYGGNTVDESARVFLRILRGEGTWAQTAVVLANAAMALNATDKYASYENAYNAAIESLECGNALKSFNQLIEMQKTG